MGNGGEGCCWGDEMDNTWFSLQTALHLVFFFHQKVAAIKEHSSYVQQ